MAERYGAWMKKGKDGEPEFVDQPDVRERMHQGWRQCAAPAGQGQGTRGQGQGDEPEVIDDAV